MLLFSLFLTVNPPHLSTLVAAENGHALHARTPYARAPLYTFHLFHAHQSMGNPGRLAAAMQDGVHGAWITACSLPLPP
jgi:hypothetical protein